MKRKISFLFIIILLSNIYYSRAQDTFKEGKLNFTLTFHGMPGDPYAAMYASIKEEEIVYIKDGNSYMKTKLKNGSMATITKEQKEKSFILTEEYGQKYAQRIADNSGLKQPDVKLTDEAILFSGYNCKKAILTYDLGNDGKQSFDCLYTKEIELNSAKSCGLNLPGIDGFLVEVTTLNHNQFITYTLASVEKMKVADSLFVVPADYPFKTKEEVEQGFKSTGKEANESNVFLPGTTVPDIELNDVNGHTLKLSSLRGSYVLVDFWAAGCVPCRAENPSVVKVYNKYKDKGFTVYSISLDSDKDDWQNAIRRDQLMWPNHVCDFKGWESPVCKKYKITGIPSNYLIDKDGKVLAIDLRGDELESKLSEIFK